jgi:hypothetical protein
MCRWWRISGSLNLLEPSRAVQTSTRIVLPLLRNVPIYESCLFTGLKYITITQDTSMSNYVPHFHGVAQELADIQKISRCVQRKILSQSLQSYYYKYIRKNYAVKDHCLWGNYYCTNDLITDFTVNVSANPSDLDSRKRVTALYFRKHHHFNISTKYITYYLMH